MYEGDFNGMSTIKRRPKSGTTSGLVRSTSDGGGIIAREEEDEDRLSSQLDDSLTYTLYSYTDGVPTGATTLIDHPINTSIASSNIRHYCTLYPRKKRPKHTIASAFTVAPKASTPDERFDFFRREGLCRAHSEGSRVQHPMLSDPEISSPVKEPVIEPVSFSSEYPIDEPDDSEALINPYYFYARAALDHWHSKTTTKDEAAASPSPPSRSSLQKGKTQKDVATGKEGSSSSSSTSIDQESTDSNSLRGSVAIGGGGGTGVGGSSLRVGGRSSGSAGASPEEAEQTHQETLKSVKGPPLPRSLAEKSIAKRGSKSSSDDSSEEIKTIMKPYEDVFAGSPIIPLSPPISVDEPQLQTYPHRPASRREEGEAILLDLSPSHSFFPPPKSGRAERVILPRSSPSPLFSDEEDGGGGMRPLLPIRMTSPVEKDQLLAEFDAEEEGRYSRQPFESLIDHTIEEEDRELFEEDEEEEDDETDYSYDPRKDPHLWPGMWKISGEIDEKIAAKVPTQPVSPCDSPSRHPFQVSGSGL